MKLSADGRIRKKRSDGPIRFRTNFRNTVYDVLRERPGWIETDSETDWDFQWAERDWVYDSFDSMHLDPWQRMNHFRNGRELCRKDLLAKNIKRVKRALEKEGKNDEATNYDFCPITFILPGDYALFVEEFKKPIHSGAVWIMKPIARSQGKGIFLFNKLAQITQWKSEYRWKPDNATVEAYVVQKYISNPYLIGGKKFDLRVYALVTNYSPLTVWIYRSGFTRFSASRYSNDTSDIVNTYVHLTNVAVQKTSTDYNPEFGGKWEINRLKMYLACKHGMEAVDKLFKNVESIMLHSLLSVQKIIINDPHCFELYGYDILIDDCLKPWLLEVNASPSMTASTRDDYDLKYKLLNDTLDIVDMEGRTSGEEMRVGGFDLVWKDGPVGCLPAGYTSSMGFEFDKHLNVWKPAATANAGEGKSAAADPVASGFASPLTSPKPPMRSDDDKEKDDRGDKEERSFKRIASPGPTNNTSSSTTTTTTRSAFGASPLRQAQSFHKDPTSAVLPPATTVTRRSSSFTSGSSTGGVSLLSHKLAAAATGSDDAALLEKDAASLLPPAAAVVKRTSSMKASAPPLRGSISRTGHVH